MTLEEAWREEDYDQMVKEFLESNREVIIDEYVSERIASYYQKNPDLAAAAESARGEARSLLESNPTASLVFSRSATEIALRDVLLKPIAYGMVHNENTGSLMAELAVRNQQFTKLLFSALEDYGVDLTKIFRNGAFNNLWAEIQEISKTRNKILHLGRKASKEQAERSLEIATMLLDSLRLRCTVSCRMSCIVAWRPLGSLGGGGAGLIGG